MARWSDSKVRMEFLEDDATRGPYGRTPRHWEPQCVRLIGSVVRILTDNDHLDGLVWRLVQGSENLVLGWVNHMVAPLIGHKFLKVLPVGLIELLTQDWIPICPQRHI